MTTMATRLPTKLKGTTEALRKALAGSKPSKYRNQPVVIDGIRFASKAEGKRYQELKLLERIGEIRLLQLQRPYGLTSHNQKICNYVADFSYLVGMTPVVEDVKGMLTPEFKLKAKLFAAQYGYPITIIGGKK